MVSSARTPSRVLVELVVNDIVNVFARVKALVLLGSQIKLIRTKSSLDVSISPSIGQKSLLRHRIGL